MLSNVPCIITLISYQSSDRRRRIYVVEIHRRSLPKDCRSSDRLRRVYVVEIHRERCPKIVVPRTGSGASMRCPLPILNEWRECKSIVFQRVLICYFAVSLASQFCLSLHAEVLGIFEHHYIGLQTFELL